jgi:hypothetical protein
MCTFGGLPSECTCITPGDVFPACPLTSSPQTGLQLAAPQGVNKSLAVAVTTTDLGYNPGTRPAARDVVITVAPGFPATSVLFTMSAAEYAQLDIQPSDKLGLADTIVRITAASGALSLAGSAGLLMRVDLTQPDGSCLPNAGVMVADLSAATPQWVAAADTCTPPFVYRVGCELITLVCRLPTSTAKRASAMALQGDGTNDIILALGGAVPTETVASVAFTDTTPALGIVSGTVTVTIGTSTTFNECVSPCACDESSRTRLRLLAGSASTGPPTDTPSWPARL